MCVQILYKALNKQCLIGLFLVQCIFIPLHTQFLVWQKLSTVNRLNIDNIGQNIYEWDANKVQSKK